MPTALLPSFLTSTLGAPAAALGLIEGVADGCAGVARFGGGALADDPERRRRAALGGYTATAVFSSLIGVTTAVWQVGALRAAAWSSRGLRVPARNALLADVVPPEAYGRAYGFERAMDNLGAIGGPLLAIGLVALVGTRDAMLVSVVPGLLATVAILYAIRATPRATEQERKPLRVRLRPVIAGTTRPVAVRCLRVRARQRRRDAADPARYPAPHPRPRPRQRGHDRARPLHRLQPRRQPRQRPGGHLGDRRSTLLVLLLGVACFGAAYLGLALTGASIALLAVCFVLAGVAIGFVETAEHAAVATLAPIDIRGSAFGALAAIQSLGNFAASADRRPPLDRRLAARGLPLPHRLDARLRRGARDHTRLTGSGSMSREERNDKQRSRVAPSQEESNADRQLASSLSAPDSGRGDRCGEVSLLLDGG